MLQIERVVLVLLLLLLLPLHDEQLVGILVGPGGCGCGGGRLSLLRSERGQHGRFAVGDRRRGRRRETFRAGERSVRVGHLRLGFLLRLFLPVAEKDEHDVRHQKRDDEDRGEQQNQRERMRTRRGHMRGVVRDRRYDTRRRRRRRSARRIR